MKYIKTIENLYEKAKQSEKNRHGYAVINGRMSLGFGIVGDLEPKYEIIISNDTVELYHWDTMTLTYSTSRNEILEYYGQSNSDRDSINTLLCILGSSERVRYFPSKDLFILDSELEVKKC